MKSKILLLPLFFILILAGVLAAAVNISPHSPIDDDNLTCSVQDAESQNVFVFEWRKNGQAFNSNKITMDEQGSHFSEELTFPGDDITCVVYIFESFLGSDTVVVREGQHENQLPIANAGPDKTANVGEVINFDASLSTDPDGTIVNYNWNFGDGNTDNNKITTHKYENPGVFTVTLEVTDNEGAVNSDVASITINPLEGDQLRILNLKTFDDSFKHESSSLYRGKDLFVSFKLEDNNGNQVSGQTNKLNLNLKNLETGRTMPLVPYNGELPGFILMRSVNGEACMTLFGRCARFNNGVYYYTTIVPYPDDYLGKSNVNVNIERTHSEKEIEVLNNKPIADAGNNVITNANEVVRFDASESVDVEDLRNLKYEWSFGDGASADGKIVEHIFSRNGVYTAVLKVTDSENDFGTAGVLVAVGRAIKQAPIASFEYSNAFVAEETLFDASRSHDEDGKIVKYEWNFGDNTKSLGKKVNHVYNLPGIYLVTLTVTDNDNLKNRFIAAVEVKYDYRLTPEDRPGMVVNSNEDSDQPGSNAVINTRDYHDFTFSSLYPVNYKQSYAPGEDVNLFLNLRNTGNMPENLNVKLTVPGFAVYGQQYYGKTSSVRVSAGSNLLHTLSIHIPENAQKGVYLVKLEVDNRIGDRKDTYWQLTIA